jgi:hypothetical protein
MRHHRPISTLARLSCVAASIALAATFASPPCRAQASDFEERFGDFLAGGDMTAEQVAEREARLAKNPEDIASRAALLGYYGDQFGDPDAAMALGSHIVWLAEHRPESDLCAMAPLLALENPAAWGKAISHFEAHMAREPENLNILFNYACLAGTADSNLALRLLEKGKALAPTEARWSEELGARRLSAASQLRAACEIRAPGMSVEEAAKASAEALLSNRAALLDALAGLEESIEEAPEGIAVVELLAEAARVAYETGEDARATRLARRALSLGAASALGSAESMDAFHVNANDAIHAGNTILGLVALRAGDLEAARNHLIASAPDGGSPVLDGLGPSMRLAAAMLEAGERDAVLRYFERCAKFWESGGERLEKWSEIARSGGAPAANDAYWGILVHR